MHKRSLFSRRAFVRAATLGALGVAGTGVYAWRVEPHWVEVVRRDLPVADLPAALEGETLVQLSDIHVGPAVDDDFLTRAFELVNELQPAFVCLTGDYMTSVRGEQIDHAARILSKLKPGRLGTVAVLGNHDFGMSARLPAVAERMAAVLRQQGVTVLRNERCTRSGLTFVGLDDFWGPFFAPRKALAGLSPDEPSITLCHNPDGADQPGWGEYRGWILCGHTHGGQVRPPFLPPPRLPVHNRRYTAGEFDLPDGRKLYINRALGYLHRVRLNVRPEITSFRLTRA
jgi:predicted MPP superfamily phosphohydrolase